eukprot:Nitzschia sp. Nitz4//scaffold22_size323478//143218//143958//NITZ4_000533-RA/size323478-processed-gene-0.400-mRNA-1//1//CDS//3329543013//3883//frame0
MNGTSNRNDGPPDATAMLNEVTQDIRRLKIEAKKLFNALKEEEAELERIKEEAQVIRKADQQKRLKGNELSNLSLLKHMGFDEEVIRDHLVGCNKTLEKNLRKKQKDRRNLEKNIATMEEMNKQSERAVAGAQTQYNNSVVENSKLQALLDTAELQLYAVENTLKHTKNLKDIEITNKDSFKKGLKEVVTKVQAKVKDEKLVRDVLRIAGKCLAADLGMDASTDGEDSDSDDSSSLEISSCSTDDS